MKEWKLKDEEDKMRVKEEENVKVNEEKVNEE